MASQIFKIDFGLKCSNCTNRGWAFAYVCLIVYRRDRKVRRYNSACNRKCQKRKGDLATTTQKLGPRTPYPVVRDARSRRSVYRQHSWKGRDSLRAVNNNKTPGLPCSVDPAGPSAGCSRGGCTSMLQLFASNLSYQKKRSRTECCSGDGAPCAIVPNAAQRSTLNRVALMQRRALVSAGALVPPTVLHVPAPCATTAPIRLIFFSPPAFVASWLVGPSHCDLDLASPVSWACSRALAGQPGRRMPRAVS